MSEARADQPIAAGPNRDRLVSVPSLDTVRAEPERLLSLPRPVLLELRRQVGHLAVELDMALTETGNNVVVTQPDGAEPDRRLSPPEAAAYLGVPLRYLCDRKVPGKIKLSHRVTVYSEAALKKYLRQRAAK
jgi:hypothetical protein